MREGLGGWMDKQTDTDKQKSRTNLELPESGRIMGIRVTRATRLARLFSHSQAWAWAGTGIARSQVGMTPDRKWKFGG